MTVETLRAEPPTLRSLHREGNRYAGLSRLARLLYLSALKKQPVRFARLLSAYARAYGDLS